MNRVVLSRIGRGATRAMSMAVGRLLPIEPILEDLAVKPARLGFEFTNLCNANCVFCPYGRQERGHQFMSDAVFDKAVADYVSIGGGDVELTPVVGDSLIHPEFVARVRKLRAHACIGHILLITNGILIDKHGAEELLSSGVSAITISTAGFQKEMYERVYRSTAYERMRRNVLELLTANERCGRKVEITLALRPDRPLGEVLADPDFAPILKLRPAVASNRFYSDAGGRVEREGLAPAYRLRVLRAHREPCAYTFDGPVILSDGTVVACNCLASMDRQSDLGLGNIMERSLLELWRGGAIQRLRASFGTPALNSTCASCTMYQGPRVFRTIGQQSRAAASRRAFESACATQSKTGGVGTRGGISGDR